jgi:hypothetical protein
MNSIKNSLVSGQIPAASQMNPGDIAVNNADGKIYVLKTSGGGSSVVQIAGLNSFNNRTGDIVLNSSDVTTALGYIPVGTNSPAFIGTPTAPTATPGASTTQLATTAFVTNAIANIHIAAATTTLDALTDVLVTEGSSIDGYFLAFSNSQVKWVAESLSAVAKTGSYADLLNLPSLSAVATSGSYTDLTNKPAAYSLPIATASVLGGVKAGTGVTIGNDGTISVAIISTLAGLSDVSVIEGATIDGNALVYNNASSKWKASALSAVAFSGKYSDLTGVPQAGGVTQFNSRTGAITLTSSDVTTALGFTPANNATVVATYAPLASPAFTGNPTAPTPSAGDNDTSIATTAFVTAAITAANAGVASFNTRTGAITLTSGDVTTALGYSPTAQFDVVPSGSASASTRYSNGFIYGVDAYAATDMPSSTSGDTGFYSGVVVMGPSARGMQLMLNWNNETGAPHGVFVRGKDDSQTSWGSWARLATSDDLNALTTGVSSFNTRTGAITLSYSDVTTALGFTPASLASPNFSGTPTAPTATAGTSTTQLATTAFVTSAITAANAGVSSFNGRTGAVSLTNSDVINSIGYIPLGPGSKYYDVVGGALGPIVASQLLAQFVSGRTVNFPAGLTNSQAYAAVAPTAAVALTIVANGTSVGTINFAAGAHTGTFTAASAFGVTAGQLITVTAPATADSTFATVSFTILGVAN